MKVVFERFGVLFFILVCFKMVYGGNGYFGVLKFNVFFLWLVDVWGLIIFIVLFIIFFMNRFILYL